MNHLSQTLITILLMMLGIISPNQAGWWLDSLAPPIQVVVHPLSNDLAEEPVVDLSSTNELKQTAVVDEVHQAITPLLEQATAMVDDEADGDEKNYEEHDRQDRVLAYNISSNKEMPAKLPKVAVENSPALMEIVEAEKVAANVVDHDQSDNEEIELDTTVLPIPTDVLIPTSTPSPTSKPTPLPTETITPTPQPTVVELQVTPPILKISLYPSRYLCPPHLDLYGPNWRAELPCVIIADPVDEFIPWPPID